MSNKMKCAFCRRSYSYVGAYFSHIRREHAERVRGLPPHLLPAAGYRHRDDFIELPQASNPVEIYPSEDSDEDNDDVIEDSDGRRLQPKSTQQGTAITLFEHAGRPLDGTFDLDEDDLDPFRPFSSKQEYQIASWCIKNSISRTAIDELLGIQGFQHLTNTTSAHRLFNKIDDMHYPLDESSWEQGYVCFDRLEDPNIEQTVPFWYRNPVECIEFLLQQPAYRDHMVYAPVREYNEEGERMYSELHTSNWWWRMQVSVETPYILFR